MVTDYLSFRVMFRRVQCSLWWHLKNSEYRWRARRDFLILTSVKHIIVSNCASGLTHGLSELLNRLQLYTCAAYLRKYSEAESIRKPTWCVQFCLLFEKAVSYVR